LTLRWTDPRTRKLVPDESKSVALPTDSAKRLMWLPDVTITNRDFGGLEVLSTSVTVKSDGSVTQTDRMLVVLKNYFDVSAFPFDTQSLHVRLGSSTLMLEDLKLEAMHGPELTGVAHDLFTENSDFRLGSVSVRTFEEHDGSLRKSRGELNVVVTRDSYPLIERVMIPELLLLAINYAAFFFPLLKQFIMPRFSACLLSFLMLITLSQRTGHMLPEDRSGFVWIEIFEECVESLMFLTVCLHILVEVIYHQWACVELASQMTHELKVLVLVQAAVVFGGVCSNRSGHDLSHMAITVRVLLFGSTAMYVAWGLKRAKDKKGGSWHENFFSPQLET